MTIEELLQEASLRRAPVAAEVDPLRQSGALVDAGLISIRVDPVVGLAALLFDCRAALAAREGNTSILVVEGLSRLDWTAKPRRRSWPRAQTWNPRSGPHGFRVDALVGPQSELLLEGEAAHYFIGNTPGLDVAPPDLTSASSEEVRAGFTGWVSEFRAIASTHFPDVPG
jgi:hypothetical protein